ncbi:hypothetical protein AVO42_00470 [Thiomicrospira sp. XS5]|nr:hypothetical protein AVO42_00470 [Thiomicrospira sp. XS5]
MLVSNLDVKMIEASTADRNGLKGFMGSSGAITVDRKIVSSFDVEFAGSGNGATAPKWGRQLMGCGFAELVGATDTTYTMVGQDFSSLAMLYRIGKVQQELLGSRGGVSIVLDQGTIPLFKFGYESLFQSPEVVAEYLSGIDFSAFKTPVGVTDVATEVTLFGAPIKMKKLTIDPGIQYGKDSHTEGESVEIEARKGTVSTSFRTSDQELVDYIEHGSNNAEGPLNAVHGVAAGNILTVNVPNLQIKTASVAWDGEFANVDVTADIRPLTANTDLTITQS